MKNLDRSLLSAKKLINKGMKIVMNKSGTIICTDYDKFVCEESNGLDILTLDLNIESSFISVGAKDELWHQRLGHAGPDALRQLG